MGEMRERDALVVVQDGDLDLASHLQTTDVKRVLDGWMFFVGCVYSRIKRSAVNGIPRR